MREYPIKRGHYANIEGEKLNKLMKDTFGNVKVDNEKLVSSYGAIDKIELWLDGKKKMCIETTMNPDVDNETAAQTIKVYNNFLFEATGFTTKERKKRFGK